MKLRARGKSKRELKTFLKLFLFESVTMAVARDTIDRADTPPP